MTIPPILSANLLELNPVGVAAADLQANVAALPDSIGICLSGGGSRALSCAMGQLRALRYLGVMDKVFAISSVSGGTWANSAYTYLPDYISDDDFLGLPVLDPSKLTVTGGNQYALDWLPPNNLGQVPTRLGLFRDLEEIWKLYEDWGYPIDDLWQGLIGEAVLKPFGLWQPDPVNHYDPHFFTYTSGYLTTPSGPLKRNPGLRAEQFYTSRNGRPFAIFNTAMFTDDSDMADLVPFEANFSLGVRQRFPLDQANTIGGGFVESFAMTRPFLKDLGAGDVQVGDAARAFTLTDIVGLSSAAFAQMLEEIFPVLSGVVPRYPYWPVVNRQTVPNCVTRFADGGSLENLGLNVMLARRVSRLLVFVNTDEAVRLVGGDVVVSSDIPPLFGLQPWVEGQGYVPYSAANPGDDETRLFRHNQVFATADFALLQTALWEAKSRKGPVMARLKLTVMANSWYGVPGQVGGAPQQVDILWVHNDFVPEFWDKLSLDVQLAIDWDGSDAFPLYDTFTQLYLPPVAVNALAHLSCWNLASNWCPPNCTLSNRDKVLAMFE